MEKHQLKITPEKTEAVVVKEPRNTNTASFIIGGKDVRVLMAVKYLGVWLGKIYTSEGQVSGFKFSTKHFIEK